MTDSDRPHRTGSSSSELFICFTSRLSSSSSSMKLSSKSILSPARSRDLPVTLSNSLSRRLRSNGSMKGGQASPMFPTGGKKRGGAFENPEPSSPKVTCIGQVRVKTKKQGKKMRTLSRRRSGEVSFRKSEQSREGLNQNQTLYNQPNVSSQFHQQNQESLNHRNQRWLHLPLTICEALRAFGSEFSCLFPCRSSCSSTSEREKEEKGSGSNGGGGGGRSSCGAVFARWLVSLHEVGEGGGKGRDIELVVGGGEEEITEFSERNSRRYHVMDEIEIRDEKCESNGGGIVEEDEARVSICVPPKNALLLMRCRSDPMRISALSNRFWESPLPKDEEEEEEEEDDDKNKDINGDEEEQVNVVEESEVKDKLRMEIKEDIEVCEKRVSVSVSDEAHKEPENLQETEAGLVMEITQVAEKVKEENPENANEELQEQVVQEVNQTAVEGENEAVPDRTSTEALLDQETLEIEEAKLLTLEEEERRASQSTSILSIHSDSEDKDEAEVEVLVEEAEKLTKETETQVRLLGETPTQERSEPEEDTKENLEDDEEETESKEERESHAEEVERESDQVKEERESSVLPDCLLLMMCEPKLSMEVSKETWVCSTDFIRWLPPERQVKPKDGGDEPKKKRDSIDSNPALPTRPAREQPLQQPPRSSCSFPLPVTGVSMGTAIEQKLVSAVGYEPFALKRCKSEPMRTAAKLAPDACFWKNRKLEPHRGATVGVGAAGVGF
ncbi:uncharacterized protein LOC132307672 [Cornus florida]|uniref:uncharacterized protein LOC132307672 n=1 Tax=Cornus florida TaxID=4283 RepID=UPI0028A27835|nr:uncharacterized protein LOC132307672 [Cornus florida]